MPKFRVTLSRTRILSEDCELIIEAPDEKAAREYAQNDVDLSELDYWEIVGENEDAENEVHVEPAEDIEQTDFVVKED